MLDYDDLLLYWHALLADPQAGPAVRKQFDCVLVDEYQDTNALQAEILYRLSPEGKGLTVVGDDAQSIYSFRAATVRNILDFPKHYPDATIVTLEQNYRSTCPILEAANRVIGLSRERFTKNLWSERTDGATAGPGELRGRERADGVRHPPHPGASRGGHRPAAPGGAVPRLASQHPAGGRVGRPQDSVSQVRRAEVRGDRPRQGPDGLPAAGGESARRGLRRPRCCCCCRASGPARPGS